MSSYDLYSIIYLFLDSHYITPIHFSSGFVLSACFCGNIFIAETSPPLARIWYEGASQHCNSQGTSPRSMIAGETGHLSNSTWLTFKAYKYGIDHQDLTLKHWQDQARIKPIDTRTFFWEVGLNVGRSSPSFCST